MAAMITLIGLVFDIGGTIAFRRARTTLNPLRPEKTRSLVTEGVYRFSRNPMYVGMLLILLAGVVFLAAPLTVLGPLTFFLYVERLQITPEERAMSKLFGAEFDAYRARVRRWL
jgi:protein-S-isoprenylcysteine O-methyltransferase Ste14